MAFMLSFLKYHDCGILKHDFLVKTGRYFCDFVVKYIFVFLMHQHFFRLIILVPSAIGVTSGHALLSQGPN